MILRRLLLPVAILACVGFGALAVRAADNLPDMRRRLLEVRDMEGINQALFDLAEKIGEDGFFADHGAFGDWLVALPDGRAEHPVVRQRIGWAYIRAGRGKEALPHLEAALANDPSDGLTRSYLGEALRQGDRQMEAAEMLATAMRCGGEAKFIYDALVLTLVQLQRKNLSGHADDLPGYVIAAEKYLAVHPDARIHQMVADMLLTDFKTFEKPDRRRGQHWAKAAGRHLIAALNGSSTALANGARMAYDAAAALEVLDRQTSGGTSRFDLLAQAYTLGINPADGTHARPRVLTLLAESAAADGRFELAYRLVQERLGISNSPRATRLLMTLPPDLEDED